MKKTNLAKYFLAYVGLAGFAVTVEASTTIVTPGSPGSWNYETAGYVTPGYNNGPSTLPIVANPAAPGTGGSVQLLTTAGGLNAAAILSTTAYDGQLLSSVNSLGYVEQTVQNNGQATPYFGIYVALGNGGYDKLFFEPTYQASQPPGPVVMNTWQTWNNIDTGLWWDNNGVLGLGGYGSGHVNTLAYFLSLYPNATIASDPYTAGGGISVTAGWNGHVNEGYVNDVTINGTTYDFEPNSVSSVPEPTTIIAGALLLLPFGASALRILRKKQTV
jgi:hypothetical protein